MSITTATLKLVKDAEEKLSECYRKTAAQRSKVADLEKQLKAAKDKLEEQTVEEAKIISKKSYAAISGILTDNKFLNDLKAEADKAYKKAKRARKKSSSKVTKLTAEAKQEAVEAAFKARKYADLKSQELKAELIKLGVMTEKGNLTQWLDALKLPKAATKSLGSNREGKLYIYNHLPW